jgi:hypothetical protein
LNAAPERSWPSNQLARMWTQGTNTTGTKHTVCGSFEEENIDTIEVVSKTTGDTEVDGVTAQIRDGGNTSCCLDEVALRRVSPAPGGVTIAPALSTSSAVATRRPTQRRHIPPHLDPPGTVQ